VTGSRVPGIYNLKDAGEKVLKGNYANLLRRRCDGILEVAAMRSEDLSSQKVREA